MQSKKPSEPGRLPAGVLAVLVHLAFLALLVFGVSWQTKPPAPVSVDLWSSVPAPPTLVVKPQPLLPKLQPLPIPKPPPKLESLPEPEPAPKAELEPPKPDIAIKEKEERLKSQQQQKAAADQRRKEEEEERSKELKRQEDEVKKQQQAKLKEAQAKAKEEQAKKLAEGREAQAVAQVKAATEKAAADAANDLVASQIDKIRIKIRQSTQVPENIAGRPQAEFKLVLLPTGELLSVTLVKSSGNPAYDDAVARGIKRAEPLPLPPNPALFPRFRELTLPFTHEK